MVTPMSTSEDSCTVIMARDDWPMIHGLPYNHLAAKFTYRKEFKIWGDSVDALSFTTEDANDLFGRAGLLDDFAIGNTAIIKTEPLELACTIAEEPEDETRSSSERTCHDTDSSGEDCAGVSPGASDDGDDGTFPLVYDKDDPEFVVDLAYLKQFESLSDLTKELKASDIETTREDPFGLEPLSYELSPKNIDPCLASYGLQYGIGVGVDPKLIFPPEEPEAVDPEDTSFADSSDYHDIPESPETSYDELFYF